MWEVYSWCPCSELAANRLHLLDGPAQSKLCGACQKQAYTRRSWVIPMEMTSFPQTSRKTRTYRNHGLATGPSDATLAIASGATLAVPSRPVASAVPAGHHRCPSVFRGSPPLRTTGAKGVPIPEQVVDANRESGRRSRTEGAESW